MREQLELCGDLSTAQLLIRKYSDMDVTYAVSSVCRLMPRWSICLKEGVSGKGIFPMT